MKTRYCFNPADPTLYRYVMTLSLMDEGFVECPPPGEKMPPGLLGGAGGVLDRTSATLAQAISKKLGPDATEAQVQAVAEAIGRMDPENMASLAEPVQRQPAITEPAPPPVGAMGSAMDVDPNPIDPPAIETDEADQDAPSIIQEMCDFPQTDPGETADSAITRIFKKRMADVNKTDILNYGLKTLKVKLDPGKIKPLLVRDLQIVEIARQNPRQNQEV